MRRSIFMGLVQQRGKDGPDWTFVFMRVALGHRD
jgi:hypothetical protein